jgi:ADP-ribosylglycohydrolase
MDLVERARGLLVGMAVGDALGQAPRVVVVCTAPSHISSP